MVCIRIRLYTSLKNTEVSQIEIAEVGRMMQAPCMGQQTKTPGWKPRYNQLSRK